YRYVDQAPAEAAQVEAGVDVLGVLDERRAAVLGQRGPAVDGAAPDAYRAGAVLPGGLYRAVEEILQGACAALDPVLMVRHARELRRLHDRQLRVALEVRQHLGEEVGARGEVGVEDEDELAVAVAEAVLEVARLLVPAAVRAGVVPQAEVLGEHLER